MPLTASLSLLYCPLSECPGVSDAPDVRCPGSNCALAACTGDTEPGSHSEPHSAPAARAVTRTMADPQHMSLEIHKCCQKSMNMHFHEMYFKQTKLLIR